MARPLLTTLIWALGCNRINSCFITSGNAALKVPNPVVDDDPSEQRVWLPAFARACRVSEPPQVTEQQALATSGADSVYYATRLRGASNENAKRKLNFRPRPLEWLQTA